MIPTLYAFFQDDTFPNRHQGLQLILFVDEHDPSQIHVEHYHHLGLALVQQFYLVCCPITNSIRSMNSVTLVYEILFFRIKYEEFKLTHEFYMHDT